jgi:glycosyltransferase involved in cell wall biosynthesis
LLTERPGAGGVRVALLSLEKWDHVWRRNQHLASQLIGQNLIGQLNFLEPPTIGPNQGAVRTPLAGIRAVPLGLRLPKRLGGLAELGWRLRHGLLRTADVLWVNDPALGVHCLQHGQPVVYDVTDDWRSFDFPPRIIRRIVAAEDILAHRARTVVCSAELRDRWRERYGIDAPIVHNGVDLAAWRSAVPRVYDGPGPHVGYVGTLQPERLDVDLVVRVADDVRVGTVHLIGPDALDEASRGRLSSHRKIRIHGPIPSDKVASWTTGLDVVLSPHLVTTFTLSLDAIKSYEYLASRRPIVATPTSGFQLLAGRRGVYVGPPADFPAAVRAALSGPAVRPTPDDLDWATRSQQFATHLLS